MVHPTPRPSHLKRERLTVHATDSGIDGFRPHSQRRDREGFAPSSLTQESQCGGTIGESRKTCQARSCSISIAGSFTTESGACGRSAGCGTIQSPSLFHSARRSTIVALMCEVCQKKPVSGNNVSHANNKTRRVFNPNIQTVRALVG